MKITEAEIVAALEAAQGYRIEELENTYTVSEVCAMWGQGRTATRTVLLKMIEAGTVERVMVRRQMGDGRHQTVAGYTFKGNGDAQGTSD